jgi:hypothetical protein
MRSTLLRRGWTAAAALVAVALAASLPAPTFAHDRAATLASSPTRVVGSAGFDRLALPHAPQAPASGSTAFVVDGGAPTATAAAAADRTATAASRRHVSVVPSAATGSGTWALVVGINDYAGTDHDLSAAVNDAAEVQKAVLQLGAPADQVRTLLDGAASADAIRNGIDWLVANAGPDSVAVLFYAGHAVKVRPGTEALVGSDMGEIRDTELADRLAPLAARKAWIGIAGCYGGGFTEVLAPGRILTGAAPANGLAYENSRFARSYMVEYMVHQAIVEGRAADSVQAAFAYASDAIARDYPDRVPVEFDQSSGPLDLRPPAAPAPAPPQQSPSTTTPPSQGGDSPPTTTPPRQNCVLGNVCG